MKDLVISAIANYLPEKIKIYIESLNDCGYDGDKVMICYNIPKETIDYLTDKGWECYGAELQGHPQLQIKTKIVFSIIVADILYHRT